MGLLALTRLDHNIRLTLQNDQFSIGAWLPVPIVIRYSIFVRFNWIEPHSKQHIKNRFHSFGYIVFAHHFF